MPSQEAYKRVFDLAKRLVSLRARQRELKNENDKLQKLISETEIELYHTVELSEGRPSA